jgi:hypothetical protein
LSTDDEDTDFTKAALVGRTKMAMGNSRAA